MFKRMRYIVGGTLILGIAAGVWLSDFLKGLGSGLGIGQNGMSGISVSADGSGASPRVDTTPASEDTATESTEPDLGMGSAEADAAPKVLRVVIREHDYHLLTATGEQPIELQQLVTMVAAGPSDADGVKLRVFRSDSARVTAELKLRDALKRANIAEGAVYVSPDTFAATKTEERP